MADRVAIGKPLRIREKGLDEFWLQDQIAANPGCLGLGELEVMWHERRQSSGGRLDLLLKDPVNDSMYEVEVMLGETDESHIIRTLEYWDNEKRRWPQREHRAVLVAESITKRFFNVIQLLSHAVPIVAIQAALVEADGQAVLHFVKVLDTYEEPEDVDPGADEVHDEAYWRQMAVWVLDAAKALQEAVAPSIPGSGVKYLKYYIAIEVGQNNYFALKKRGGGKALLQFGLPTDLLPQAAALLDESGIAYTKKADKLRLAVDDAAIRLNGELFRRIAELVKQAWERLGAT